MSKYSDKIKYLFFIGCMFFTISGCSYSSGSKQYISNIMNNMEDASAFFEDRQLEISIENMEGNMEGKNGLQVTTPSGVKYLYADGAYNGELLYEIEVQVSCEDHGEEYEAMLSIGLNEVAGEEDIAEVMVDEEFGITALKYYLPDFEELVVPRWGDYAEAQLELEKWTSSEELSALYEQGKEIEQLLIGYSEGVNQYDTDNIRMTSEEIEQAQSDEKIIENSVMIFRERVKRYIFMKMQQDFRKSSIFPSGKA